MAVREFSLSTSREDFVNITRQVAEAVRDSGVTDGVYGLLSAHYRGDYINENADPDVVRDLPCPRRPIPIGRSSHAEGNPPRTSNRARSARANRLSSVGGSCWEPAGHYLRVDGPRSRRFYVQVTEKAASGCLFFNNFRSSYLIALRTVSCRAPSYRRTSRNT